MKDKYVVESKPLDGRYDGAKPLVIEGEFLPIYDKLGIMVFAGGRFPSGHREVYAPNKGPWYAESLPMSHDKATEYLAERVSRFEAPFEYRMRCTDDAS